MIYLDTEKGVVPMKKLIAAILAILCLAGCGNAKNQVESATTTVTKTEAPVVEAPAEEPAEPAAPAAPAVAPFSPVYMDWGNIAIEIVGAEYFDDIDGADHNSRHHHDHDKGYDYDDNYHEGYDHHDHD